MSTETGPDAVATLVRRAEAGEPAAWAALVARFTPLLWSVCRAHRLDEASAADVVQTTWLRLVENLGRLTEPHRVGAWLATTARRECLRVHSRSGRERAEDLQHLDRADDAAPVPGDALLDAARDAVLWREFGRLSERCQAVLRVLLADPPPSYQEVSAALDMPVGSIGPTRQRCLRQLRDALRADGMDPAGTGSTR